jgi:hypothetical protein
MSNDQSKTEQSTETKTLGEKLQAAGKKAERAKAQRRERAVKGSHLLDKLVANAKAAKLSVEEKSGFHKVTHEGVKGKAIYIAKKGGRVDLSGFSVDSPAVRQITEADARDKHLGKVRGQLDFAQTDEAVLGAYSRALDVLVKAEPPAQKPKAEPKAPKAPKAAAAPKTEAPRVAGVGAVVKTVTA